MLNLWPFYHRLSSVTLTFNLLEQMFQMAILLFKENKCAKSFWNPCINLQDMAQTNSIFDHFISWPPSVTLTFNLPQQMFHMALLPQGEQLCQSILKFMHKCTSYVPNKSRQMQTHIMLACMHIHRTEVVTTMSRSLQAGSTKMIFIPNGSIGSFYLTSSIGKFTLQLSKALVYDK